MYLWRQHFILTINHDTIKVSNKKVYSFIPATFGNIIFSLMICPLEFQHCLCTSYNTVSLNVSKSFRIHEFVFRIALRMLGAVCLKGQRTKRKHSLHPVSVRKKMYWDAGCSVAVLRSDQIQNQLDGPLTYNRQGRKIRYSKKPNRNVIVFLFTETSAWNLFSFI